MGLFDLEAYTRRARQCVADGIVLLKNDRSALPLQPGTKVALFGRSQYNYYKSGTGSGGMVNTGKVWGVKEALKEDGRFPLDAALEAVYDAWIKEHPFNPGQGWANEPWFQEEMPVSDELAQAAAQRADAAIVLIGRTAGEDQDNSNARGSWLLTEDEEAMLAAVTGAFSRTIVLLNTGNIIDMNWVARYDPAAVLYIWQGGQVGGLGALDVLSGDVNPSGRLTDTIARSIDDYPSTKNFGGADRNVQQEDIYVGYRWFETFAKDNVLYPFGYGLSYTTFAMEASARRTEDGAAVTARVRNTGSRTGRQVVQVYLEAPQGLLGKPLRSLVGFAKTKPLAPGEAETLTVDISDYLMASYDDAGKTGHRSAYVMEAGEYILYAGSDVRAAQEAGRFTLNETKVVCQLSEALAPVESFQRVIPRKTVAGYEPAYEDAPLATRTKKSLRDANLPEEIAFTGDRGLKLKDVAEGNCAMEAFIAQLTDDDLACIVRGEGMSSPKVTPGCGGAFGGVTDRLLSYGIPIACVTDGPSGIRMDSGKRAFALPNGACLAATWDIESQEALYQWEGMELRKNKIDALLGPGMNLHRNPLNGRNFEYFSEDPLVTGRCAAAQLRGMRKWGVTGVVKHFAMNTQETRRHFVDHVVSERAARELYLRGFELAVKEGGAHAVMTTYGSINGTYTASNYDLVTRILRGEWGFKGIAMTDWWAKGSEEGGQGDATNMASMIREQNDLYMVTGSAQDNTNHDNSLEALADGRVTRGEYQRSTANICRFILGKPVFARSIGAETEEDRALQREQDEDQLAFDNMIDCRVDETGRCAVAPEMISTARGAATMLSVSPKERGTYRLTMTLRTKQLDSHAQVPMSIYRDKALVKEITLTGSDNDWRTIEIDLPHCFFTFFLKLYFAQAGMEIGRFEIALAQSDEERARKVLARLENDKAK